MTETTASKKNILIYSKDSGFSKIASSFLQREDMIVANADSREAVEQVIFHEKLDLLIAKLDDDGRETADLFKSVKSDISDKALKIIAVGSPGHNKMKELILNCGVDTYFTTPLNKTRFLQSICGTLGLYVRKQPRVPAELDVRYSTSEGESFFTKCSEISSGGMFIVSQAPQTPGTTVNLSFQLPSGSVVSCWAKVTWARGIHSAEIMNTHPGMGVRFLNIDDKLYDKIERFVRSMLMEHAARISPDEKGNKFPNDSLSMDVENQIFIRKINELIHYKGGTNEDPFRGTDYENLILLTAELEEWERNAFTESGIKPDVASMLRNIIALRLRIELKLHSFWKSERLGGTASQKLIEFAGATLAATEKGLRDIFDFKLIFTGGSETPEAQLINTAQVSLMRPVLQLRDLYDVYRRPDEERYFSALVRAEDLLRDVPDQDAYQPAKYESLTYREIKETKREEAFVPPAAGDVQWHKIKRGAAFAVLFIVLPLVLTFTWFPYLTGKLSRSDVQKEKMIVLFNPKKFSHIINLERAYKKEKTLWGTVTTSWLGTNMQTKAAKVEALLSFLQEKGIGIKDILLCDSNGATVAYYSPPTLIVDGEEIKEEPVAPPPPPSQKAPAPGKTPAKTGKKVRRK